MTDIINPSHVGTRLDPISGKYFYYDGHNNIVQFTEDYPIGAYCLAGYRPDVSKAGDMYKMVYPGTLTPVFHAGTNKQVCLPLVAGMTYQGNKVWKKD